MKRKRNQVFRIGHCSRLQRCGGRRESISQGIAPRLFHIERDCVCERRQLRHRCRETATRTVVFDPRLALESDYLRHRRNLSLFIRCPNPVLTFSLVRLGIERGGGSVLPQNTYSRSRWGTHCNLGRRFNAKSTELHSSWPVPRCSVSWPWSSVWPATRKPS